MLFVFLLFSMTVLASGMRIVGWKMEVYDMQSRTKYYNAYDFGDTSQPGSSESEITWGGHMCWNSHLSDTGYCYIRIKLTTDVNREHYQIVGGFKRVTDSTSSYVDNESTWGQTQKNNPRQVGFAQGYSWSGRFNEWGYMYLDMFVITSKNPGFITALGEKRIKADDRNYVMPEIIKGGSTSGAVRREIGEFRGWTQKWLTNSIINMGMYRVPTELISVELHVDQQSTTVSPLANDVMSMILLNNGCGTYEEGSFGTFQDTETVSQSNRAMFSQTFNFEFSLSYEIGFDIGITSQSVSVGFSFGYSSSQEFETTKTVTKERTFTWPNYCPPGYKCKISIMKDSGEAEIPVDFHFKRSGETFTERNIMQVHLETIRQERHTESIPTNENC